MTRHEIVSDERWLQAREQLLQKEKAFTRLRDELSAERRALPWRRVDKPYTFETSDGTRTLAELFRGRSQLAVYHFMFGPEVEVGCKSCSFWADSFDGTQDHLAQRDVTFLAVSRSPLPRLQAFARRFGWRFEWVSSGDGDFNYDFGVSFRPGQVERGAARYNYAPFHVATSDPPRDRPGVSVFARDDAGAVFHTYSAYSRGIDALNTAYQFLDLVPKGRDEGALPYTMAWVKHRDLYDR
jgi:predicted dithiol-disulfide oxidoreductase (DUF899 family)